MKTQVPHSSRERPARLPMRDCRQVHVATRAGFLVEYSAKKLNGSQHTPNTLLDRWVESDKPRRRDA